MAELSLRERLQPALLDRLIDEERLLTIYALSFERARLVRLGIRNVRLAVGFGVRSREDVATIDGHADIAVVGSETIRVIDERGIDAIPGFIRGLR